MAPERLLDPVIEFYKKDVDRGLLREALKLTPEERILELIKLQKLARDLKEAGVRASVTAKTEPTSTP